MEKKQGFFEKLRAGLKKTRDNWFDSLFGEDRITEEFYEELEEAMILADMGAATASELIEALKEQVKTRKLKTCADTKQALIELIAGRVETGAPFVPDTAPAALLIVGVNGVGKTTSIGKIAHDYAERGRRPMLAAADTFRAAAAEQLGDWAQRAGVPMVRHQEGSDPAAVVYDAIASYKAKGCDLLIVDTAGRLHNKKNLMNELAKIRKVIARELPELPCEVLLVLDGTTGQNAVAQAQAFQEACALTGVVLTKLDGTAKGGVVVNIVDTLHVPVRFIGVGEGIDDLKRFSAEEFARALL
ncbi:MAG: signal recognition particle-docking protein FtsY [Eubacteriales bacterium]|jgi:fused signal recognition particle receptor|nr:signal recognition particle-docking protein FtsY [Clostridiales bacterium]MDD7397386.1 signal recognition particle-docking protein FtsY [Eubacteriales bacterium]MDY2981969.1 signal recognition particle-docking protein FtsY [Eubacteriales bacterium]